MSRALGSFSMRVIVAKKMAGVLIKRMTASMLPDSISSRMGS